MAIVDVYNLQKEKISERELKGDIFQVPIKKHILHQVVISQLVKRRAGTSSAKSRSEIKSSGRKLWRQKGTGRARVGAASSPTRVGGGVAFGPSLRKYSKKVSKKIRKSALKMALSDKLSNEHLIIVDNFDMAEIKTKAFMNIIRNFNVNKALIIIDDSNENLEKSSKNVQGIKILRHEGLNVYDIIKYDHLFLIEPTIEKIEEALLP